eukprot:10122953-Lingulodinium_polyedra.AAC.1
MTHLRRLQRAQARLAARGKVHEQASELEKLRGAVVAAAAAQDMHAVGRDEGHHAGAEDSSGDSEEVQRAVGPEQWRPTFGAGRWSQAAGVADAPEERPQRRE